MLAPAGSFAPFIPAGGPPPHIPHSPYVHLSQFAGAGLVVYQLTKTPLDQCDSSAAMEACVNKLTDIMQNQIDFLAEYKGSNSTAQRMVARYINYAESIKEDAYVTVKRSEFFGTCLIAIAAVALAMRYL